MKKLGAWSGAERVEALTESALLFVGSQGRRLHRRTVLHARVDRLDRRN